jgi:hypothetical protein
MWRAVPESQRLEHENDLKDKMKDKQNENDLNMHACFSQFCTTEN